MARHRCLSIAIERKVYGRAVTGSKNHLKAVGCVPLVGQALPPANWSLAISRPLRRIGGACFSLPGERSSPAAKSGEETRFGGLGELLKIPRLESQPTSPAAKARNKGKEKP
jgi:hypothetical protein